MTIKVRSVDGDSLTNDSTYQLNSPATITANDLLVAILCMNDDTVADSALTPPTGWTLAEEITDAAVGDRGMRYIAYTKVATSVDVTNQGTASYYDWTGGDGVLDLLYGIFSIYDDASGVITYKPSSLADNLQTGSASTTANAPTQTIANDASLVFSCWSARQGTDYFDIGSGTSYSPTGGDVATLHHGSFTANGQADLEWVVGTAEFSVADSPIGTQVLTHLETQADVDTYSSSMVFEVSPATAVGYFGSGYWNAHFWADKFWAAATEPVLGRYWHNNYWHANYWQANFWADGGVDSGDVFQNNAATLGFTELNPTLQIGLGVQATTPTLGFTEQAANARLDIDPAITTPTLSLTPLSPGIGLEGYQLADIDVNFTPVSTITVTYNTLATIPSLGFTPTSHSIDAGDISVGASVASLDFTPFVTDANLNVSVEPLPPSLGFTSFDTTAGIGAQIPTTQPTLDFTVANHLIVASNATVSAVFPNAAVLALTPLNADVDAGPEVVEEPGDAYVQGRRPRNVGISGRF